jgi:hypothetical protein
MADDQEVKIYKLINLDSNIEHLSSKRFTGRAEAQYPNNDVYNG